MIPEDMTGMRAVELGCGTGYVSAWMSRRGARVVAVDMSEKQLATARRLSQKHGIDSIHFVHGNAESVPLPAESCDFAISEYGAAIWCDPRVWIPEAHRLLKPGGRLAFLGTTPLVQCCMPLNGAAAEPTLHRDYFGMHEIDWQEVEIDPGGVEFNLPISSWLRLFRSVGFAVEDYLELQAPADAPSQAFAIPADWARRWPSEQVWKLRRI
ncbi:MAG: class I SAM-dependent methyltransferase [Candidatus Eisenbacteria bacterium]